MDVTLAGDGPATDAVRAALADAEATVRDGTPDDTDAALAVVVAPTGSDVFDHADRSADRWLAVELGGVGGRPAAVDAAVTAFDERRFRDLRARVASHADELDGDATEVSPSARRLAGAVAGRLAVAALAGEATDGRLVEVSGTTTRERRVLPAPDGPPERAPRKTDEGLDVEAAAARAEQAVDERVGLVALPWVFEDTQSAFLMYWITPEHRGNGYATAATELLLDYVFRECGFHKIAAYVHEENDASAALLESLGFQREGVLRQEVFIDGEWIDQYRYGMLAGQWRD